MPEIFNKCNIPSIYRATDYYLYDRSGKRYVDFWQEDGWAVLGHRPLGVMKTMKNVLSRGVWGNMPSVEEGRLCKALQQLLPGWNPWKTCTSLKEAAELIEQQEGTAPSITDPLLSDTGHCMLWRPFLEKEISPDCEYLLPILPFPWMPRPWIICTKKKHRDFETTISPVLCTALRKAVYNLLHRVQKPPSIPSLVTADWKQIGRYLVYTGQSYEDEFQSLLRRGIFVSPYGKTAIIPPLLTEKEQLKWSA